MLASLAAIQGCAVTKCRPGVSPNTEILSGASRADLSMMQVIMVFGPLIKCEVE
jgi:hypothetical protein